MKRKSSDLTVEFKRAAVALMTPGVKSRPWRESWGCVGSGFTNGGRLCGWAMVNCGGQAVRSGRSSHRHKPTIWRERRSA